MGKAVLNVSRGRPRKPTKIKELQGTARADRELPNEVEYKVIDLIPQPPAYFDACAKKLWLKVSRNLQETKLLQETDLELLTGYCYQYSIMEKAAKELKKSNSLLIKFKNKAGGVNYVANPHIKIYNDAINQVNRIGQLFGFSPVGRSRVPSGKKEEGDGFDNF